MQSSYDDSEPRNVLNNSAHYYAYDHTGNRILKANMFFGNVGVNSNQTLSVPMEAPTVYVNPYYITSHFEEVVLSSKHYYMGSQRIASNMISADFDHEAPLLEPIQAPEGRYGYTNAEAAIVDDILSTLRCLTGDEELAFDLGDFLYLPSIGEGITFIDDEGADLAAEELPAWLACTQSLYWAQQEGVNCSGLELLYFYHSDYLGSVEFVTDMRGEPYQFFLNTPWGENIENQFARNYTAFSSRFRFNGKEWDEETGNFYYGARYYDPKISVWLSVDPLAHEFPGWGPYNFTMNNPLNLVDPDGRAPTDPTQSLVSRAANWLWGQAKNYVYQSAKNIVIQSADYLNRAFNPATVYSNITNPNSNLTKSQAESLGKHSEVAETFDVFISSIEGLSESEVKKQSEGSGRFKSRSGGPDVGFVVDPANEDRIIDMKHFLVVGDMGEAAGLAIEGYQGLDYDHRRSAWDLQDFYSNELGQQFYDSIYYQDYKDGAIDFPQALSDFFEAREALGQ